jgi:hypothetical protein
VHTIVCQITVRSLACNKLEAAGRNFNDVLRYVTSKFPNEIQYG